MSAGAWIVLSMIGAMSVLLMGYVVVFLPRRQEASMESLLVALSRACELRMPWAKNTTPRVMKLAMMIADRLQLSPKSKRIVHDLALVRDVGVCAIAYADLQDPDHAPNLASHAEEGAELLQKLPGFRHLAPWVKAHHKPYADHVIPIEAAIVGLAEDFVLGERRMGRPEILARILMQSGSQYDPKLVAELNHVLPSLEHDDQSESPAVQGFGVVHLPDQPDRAHRGNRVGTSEPESTGEPAS
jgi:response regulator RpfG family c-di-GMP phosphodiesterase